MAYLSNLIVAGNSKFLNKIYAEDLEVSGTFGTTGNVSVGGNLSVTGTSTLTGAVTVSGTATFNDKVSFKGNGVELYRTSPYIDFHFNNSTADYTSRIIEESSGAITIKPNLVVGSSATIPTATITTGTISNATIGNGIVTNLNVMDTLRATHYDLQTVAQLGGAFYVSPTIKFPTASNANIVVTKSDSTLTMVITDTSTITSTTMAGVVWQANAKIKASGKIGTVTTGTMDGTVTAVNVSSHSMTISVSGGNADDVQAGTYNKADIDNFCVMMYHTGNNPVGIMMNSYGTNGLTYIDIYGGASTDTYTTPNVRIGNLGGLVFNGSTLSNQWGIYTNNGYFSGKIIANGGTIGGFTIGDTAIYTGTLTSATDNYIGLSTADFTRSIGGTSRTGLRMAIGDKFGVTGDGTIYLNNLQANGGSIGGWIITGSSLYKSSTEDYTEGAIQYGSILQAPTSSTITNSSGAVAFGIRQRTYTNGAYTDWTYPFIVKYNGSLKATDADISGKITATSGSISGSLVTSGINADNITAGTISIERLTSIKVGGRNLLLGTGTKTVTTLTEANKDYYPTGSEANGYFTESDYGKSITNGNTTDYFTVSFEWSSTSTTGEAWIQIDGNIVTNVVTASGNATRSKSMISLGDSGNNGGKDCKYIATFKLSATQANKASQRMRLRIAGSETAQVAGSTFTFWNLKFERGSASTEWSAAPEDIDADIQQVQNNLDNLEVGGRNLFKDSEKLGSSWVKDNGTVSEGIVTLDLSQTGEIRLYQMPANGYWTWQANQNYTVSIDAKANSNGLLFFFNAVGLSKQSDDIPLTTEWKRYTWTITGTSATSGSMSFFAKSGQSGTIQFRKPQLELGTKATDWTLAPEDLQTDINLALSQSIEYIIGTQTATTGSWTGTSSTLTELKDGTQIRYWLPYAGSGNATLNLTLKNGTTTGAINVYRQGGSASSSGVVTANRVTTHYPAGSSISMTYGINRVVSAVYSGTTYTDTFTGWFVDGAYDSGNTYNRVRMQNAIKAVTAITSGRIICGTDSGYKNISVNTSFDLSYPLLYATSGINANKTGDNNYLQINGINASSNGTITSGAANKMLYLKGTVNGNEFTIAPSPFMTTVTPTAVDNYVYIPLGIMYSTTNIYFISSDKLYAFKDGSFRELSRGEASLAAKTATNYIYYDTTNGLIISDTAHYQTYAGASQGYNTQLTNDALNIRYGTDVLASYGSSVILGSKTAINIGTTVIPYPTHVEITPKSIELYKKTTTSFTNIFSVGYGDALARKTEASKEYGTYLSLDGNNHLESATYTTSLDMVSSTADILVQLRGIIKDTDATVSDDSTDAIEIKPTEETNEAYAQYEGTLKLSDNDFSVDYTLDTITINETNRVMEFLSDYKTKYNIYIWVSYLASNSDEIYHFDLGQRRSSTTYGPYSLITGYNNTASNTFSITMGRNNKNDGYKALVNGESNEIIRGASCSSAFGEGLKITRENGMVIGKYNSYTNGLFIVGNGTDDSHRQDAFVIRDRGKVYIYGDYAALTITPNNNDGRDGVHDSYNGGILSLSPSLQHDDLCGYSIKNVNDKLAIYATPSRDKTTRNYYGDSLYIQSFNVSGDKSTTEILRGVVLGRYDIQTTGYSKTSATIPTSGNIDSTSINSVIRKNGWVVVELNFVIKKNITAWTTLYNIPSGYRPIDQGVRSTTSGYTFQVTTGGNVQPASNLSATTNAPITCHLHITYPCNY